MRGHIVKRGKNSYSIAVSLGRDPQTGKYKQQWVSVKGAKKDAEKRLSELLHQLDNGTFIKPGKTTLGEYLERWLKDYCQANLAPTTAQTYQFFVERHIKPTLGSTLLTQLRPEHLQRLYRDKLSGGLGNRSVKYIHTTLHKALKSAVRLGMIARNPADAVDTPRLERPEIQVMNGFDIATLLDAARETPYFTLFHTALFTGMRRSELLALRWSDLDLLLCQVSVNRSLHVLRGGKVVFRSPKTAKARRTIALSPSTVSVLREHREKQTQECVFLGVPLNDDDLVFSQLDGKPLLPDTITHVWRRLVRRIGLEDIRFHDLRHTHASLMLKAGVHPKVVQERLGHASIEITLDVYSHLVPGLQEAAAQRFDDIVNHKAKTEAVESHY
jgi:integrase